jgi:hypothetical protein
MMRLPDQSVLGLQDAGGFHLASVLGRPWLQFAICTILPAVWLAASYLYRRARRTEQRGPLFYFIVLQSLGAISLTPLLALSLSVHESQYAAMAKFFLCSTIALTGVLAIWYSFNLLEKALEAYAGIYRVVVVVLRWITAVTLLVVANRCINATGNPSFDYRMQQLAAGIGAVQLLIALLLVPCTLLVRRSARARYQDILLGFIMIGFADALLGFAPSSGLITSDPVVTMQQMVMLATVCFWAGCFASDAGLLDPASSPWFARAVYFRQRFLLLARVALPILRSR